MLRSLVGSEMCIRDRFEDKGYKLVAVKLVKPSRELLSLHYAEHRDKHFFPDLLEFMSSGPVLAMVFEGNRVIETGRRLIGSTAGFASPAGTIRGDHAVGIWLANVVHGSDSVEAAEREIKLWFPDQAELIEWDPTFFRWTMW
eukprot:TRINITY_DN27543_c0_g1_i1.p1 TRINITY_DN27543_c0_g1~~TRINITY_DN27543_c0_g1_i1.p1  ORF type:complete len:143 (-),score=39.40 TRINITY_DN27543_c0_g1_i1:333-761(-)